MGDLYVRIPGEQYQTVEGPANRIQYGPDPRDVLYQVDEGGPGVQFEWYGLRPEHVGWYAYEDGEGEHCDDGPFTEAEALDWLWRNPPGEWVEVARG